MKLQLHYCPFLRALTVRFHVGTRSYGADVYRYLTGLSLFIWKDRDELHAWDFGRVG